MISVIVATYNQENTIARTLDSVLCQKCHQPFEVVVGDDCSTDRTPDICRDYAARYPQIRLFLNAHNKGVLDNYFDLLLACRGEYIADCAGDDFWVDDRKLEKAVTLMEADPEITIVHTAWRSYNERTHEVVDSPPQPFPAPVTDGRLMLEAILTQTRMPVIQLCSSLYRASTVLEAYHADTALFRDPEMGCEDLQIAFFLAMKGKIAYLPDVTLHYSQGEETVSSSRDERKQFRFDRRVTMLSHVLSERYHIKGPAVSRFFSRRAFTLLMHAFRAHDEALRREALACRDAWDARPTLAFTLVKAVTSNDLLWRLALRLREKLR